MMALPAMQTGLRAWTQSVSENKCHATAVGLECFSISPCQRVDSISARLQHSCLQRVLLQHGWLALMWPLPLLAFSRWCGVAKQEAAVVELGWACSLGRAMRVWGKVAGQHYCKCSRSRLELQGWVWVVAAGTWRQGHKGLAALLAWYLKQPTRNSAMGDRNMFSSSPWSVLICAILV